MENKHPLVENKIPLVEFGISNVQQKPAPAALHEKYNLVSGVVHGIAVKYSLCELVKKYKKTCIILTPRKNSIAH